MRFENPRIQPTVNLDKLLVNYMQLGKQAETIITKIHNQLDTKLPTLNNTLLWQKINAYGRGDRNGVDKFRELIERLNNYASYTPTMLSKDTRIPPATLNQMCDESGGILIIKKTLDANGNPTRKNTYILKENWEDIVPSVAIRRTNSKDEEIKSYKKIIVELEQSIESTPQV